MTDDDKRRRKPEPKPEEPSQGQFGGLRGDLGYGAGRDIEDAARPAKDRDRDDPPPGGGG